METKAALQMYFKKKRASSPGFSIRALAKRLNVSASFLSRVLNGKKPVPARLLPKLAFHLDIEPEFFRKHSTTESKKSPPVHPVANWELGNKDVSQILRNWYYIPILELLTLKNYNGTEEEIAKRLGITIATTKIALREMQALDLIKIRNGKHQKANTKLRITSSKSTSLIRRFHDDMLTRAQLELRNHKSDDDFQRRLISGITISAHPDKIQEAKTRLAEFLHTLANDLIDDEGTEVYHLSAQLFPLSK